MSSCVVPGEKFEANMSSTSLSERITIATSGPRRSIRIRTRPFFFSKPSTLRFVYCTVPLKRDGLRREAASTVLLVTFLESRLRMATHCWARRRAVASSMGRVNLDDGI